jgi:16S rRNA processing protein RimM
VVVGVVAKAHGIRGDVVVLNRSDNPERWRPGGAVFLGDRMLEIEEVRSASGDRLLVRFAGVSDRSAAEALRGELTVPASWLPPIDGDGWWAPQLQGCLVKTERGRVLGRVRDVLPHPANDVWVAVDADGRETLVPAIADVVLDVDVAARNIVVRDMPGLTEPDEG